MTPKTNTKNEAFDLFDCLQLFINDPYCAFYPYHPDFTYKRIGRTTIPQPGYPTFKPDPDTAIPFSSLTGHASELNLSILAKIPGTIELPDFVEKPDFSLLYRDEVDLPKILPTHIYRNYTILENAELHIEYLHMRSSIQTMHTLANRQLVPENQADTHYTLNLQRIPLCKGARGEASVDCHALSDLAVTSLRYGAIIKVLKAERNALDPERVGEQLVTRTDLQNVFLTAVGIDRNGAYAPPTSPTAITETKPIDTFTVKVAKSSPVSIADFNDMLTGEKKLNLVGTLMKIGKDMIAAHMPHRRAEALVWLHEKIQDYSMLKREADFEISSRKLAAVLSGAWQKMYGTDVISHTQLSKMVITLQYKENVEKKM